MGRRCRLGSGLLHALSQVGGPLDNQASAMVRGGEVVPFFMTPSLHTSFTITAVGTGCQHRTWPIATAALGCFDVPLCWFAFERGKACEKTALGGVSAVLGLLVWGGVAWTPAASAATSHCLVINATSGARYTSLQAAQNAAGAGATLWLLAVGLLGAGPPGGLSQVGRPFDGQASGLVSGV